MDTEPVGSIPDEEAMLSANDAFRFRNGFYNNLRALSTGGYIYLTELQMDNFIGIISNGNVNGPINNGVILSGDSDMESIWGGLYGAIANINYFFTHVQTMIDSGVLTEVEDQQSVNRYVAEAHFMRAYFYYWLLDHYCPAYSDETKDQLLGLPLVTNYNPTASKDGYPGRSTLAETYKFIEDDLKEALDGLLEWEAIPDDPDSEIKHAEALTPRANYVGSWVVKALQARVALLKRDYRTAATLAKEVIDCGIYTLANARNYDSMWTKDDSNELMLRPLSTTGELGISSTGGGWIGTTTYTAYYLPVPYVVLQGELGLYRDNDARYTAFFKKRKIQVEGKLVEVPAFVKYPGNSALDEVAGTNSLLNMAKPFRLSEMYLIAAEASYESGDEATANKMLENIRKNRYTRATTYPGYSGTALRDEIRLERNRELIGEGFRMSDLRRWGLGFSRTDVNYTNYPQAGAITTVAGARVTYQPNDYRYTWPIPAAEIQVNPQLAGQQNPGY